jgi:hypothetical protein
MTALMMVSMDVLAHITHPPTTKDYGRSGWSVILVELKQVAHNFRNKTVAPQRYKIIA